VRRSNNARKKVRLEPGSESILTRGYEADRAKIIHPAIQIDRRGVLRSRSPNNKLRLFIRETALTEEYHEQARL
jgi:hypothetical protein